MCHSFTDTLAFSLSLANSPLHAMQCSGVTSRKQSPLLSERAEGSTRRAWTCQLPVTTDINIHKKTHDNTDTVTQTTTQSTVSDLWRGWASVCCREDTTPHWPVNWTLRSSYALSTETIIGGFSSDKTFTKKWNKTTTITTELTLLCLSSLLSTCTDSVSHVVLSDVLSGSQGPQRVPGALGSTRRTHRAPVLRYRWRQSEHTDTRYSQTLKLNQS